MLLHHRVGEDGKAFPVFLQGIFVPFSLLQLRRPAPDGLRPGPGIGFGLLLPALPVGYEVLELLHVITDSLFIADFQALPVFFKGIFILFLLLEFRGLIPDIHGPLPGIFGPGLFRLALHPRQFPLDGGIARIQGCRPFHGDDRPVPAGGVPLVPPGLVLPRRLDSALCHGHGEDHFRPARFFPPYFRQDRDGQGPCSVQGHRGSVP